MERDRRGGNLLLCAVVGAWFAVGKSSGTTSGTVIWSALCFYDEETLR